MPPDRARAALVLVGDLVACDTPQYDTPQYGVRPELDELGCQPSEGGGQLSTQRAALEDRQRHLVPVAGYCLAALLLPLGGYLLGLLRADRSDERILGLKGSAGAGPFVAQITEGLER